MIYASLPIFRLFPLTTAEEILALNVLSLWLIPIVVSYIFTKIKFKKVKNQSKVWMIYMAAFCLFNVIYWPIAQHVGYQLLMSL